jgi:hypothetical protein
MTNKWKQNVVVSYVSENHFFFLIFSPLGYKNERASIFCYIDAAWSSAVVDAFVMAMTAHKGS